MTDVLGWDRSSSPAPSPRPLGDFNGDSDILWQNSSGQSAVWLMNGATPFSEPLVDSNPGSNWQVIGAGDFNGDGDPTSCGKTPTAKPRSG